MAVATIPDADLGWLREHAGADVDSLSGDEFERCLGVMFDLLGYAVELTEYYDHGADLLLTKDGIKTAVQAKRMQDRVGDRAVQAVAAARPYYRCTAAMVVTNSEYQGRTRNLAEANGVELWDRTRLEETLTAAEVIRHPLESLPAPQCGRCRIPLVRRDGKHGPFWGCLNFPTRGCRCRASIRHHLVLAVPPWLALEGEVAPPLALAS